MKKLLCVGSWICTIIKILVFLPGLFLLVGLISYLFLIQIPRLYQEDYLPYHSTNFFGAEKEYYYNDTCRCLYSSFITIPPEIDNFVVGKRYIVVKQKPTGKPARCVLKSNITETGVHVEDPILFDSLPAINYPFDEDNRYYWIIDKYLRRSYGPLTTSQYKLQCDSLHIY